jgi:hypothetical protein
LSVISTLQIGGEKAKPTKKKHCMKRLDHQRLLAFLGFIVGLMYGPSRLRHGPTYNILLMHFVFLG